MKFAWGFVVLAPLLVCLSGCRILHAIDKRACHEPQPYQKATSVAPLSIPQGLAPPDTTNALRLPALNEPGPPPRAKTEPCLDEPPPYKVPPSPPAPKA